MSIETDPRLIENNERQPLFYPERPSYSAQRLLHEISKYQSGEKQQEPLTPEEYLESINFENPFVDELAKLYSISYDKKHYTLNILILLKDKKSYSKQFYHFI